MSQRLIQVNELLRKEIALAIEQLVEVPDVLITVVKVDCAPNLKTAQVWTSILPDNKTGTALQAIRKQASAIRNMVKAKVKLRNIPQFSFSFDDTEKNAAVIEDTLQEIANSDAL